MLPISVVIPCYRQEQWLKRAVDSALVEAAHILVVMDGGTLFDWQSYPNFGTQINSLILGGDFRAGVCYARNLGIDYAAHDLILCLDADDRLYPDTLSRLYAAWQPSTWVYPGWYDEIDEAEQVIGNQQTPPSGLLFRKNLAYSTFLFHRDDWRKTGGFDPDFEFGDEDYAFQCALTHAGVKPVRTDAGYQRMLHEKSRSSKARPYWDITLKLAREKYGNVFAGH